MIFLLTLFDNPRGLIILTRVVNKELTFNSHATSWSYNSAHFGDIRSNRKWNFENGVHRKWKFDFIFTTFCYEQSILKSKKIMKITRAINTWLKCDLTPSYASSNFHRRYFVFFSFDNLKAVFILNWIILSIESVILVLLLLVLLLFIGYKRFSEFRNARFWTRTVFLA